MMGMFVVLYLLLAIGLYFATGMGELAGVSTDLQTFTILLWLVLGCLGVVLITAEAVFGNYRFGGCGDDSGGFGGGGRGPDDDFEPWNPAPAEERVFYYFARMSEPRQRRGQEFCVEIITPYKNCCHYINIFELSSIFFLALRSASGE